MPLKIYKRIGIRRDKNLSDVDDSKAALNNVLDGLATGVNQTFIAEDLNAIKNIFASGMTGEQYRLVGGSAIEETVSANINLAVEPRITYQNRLDQNRLFSGIPRLNGGDGPIARYFDRDQIINAGSGAAALQVWEGEPFTTDKFWEAGNFAWDRKIHPSAANVNGGVEWEGWFVPTRTGKYSFQVDSTGNQTFDFQDQSWSGTTSNHIGVAGTYKEYSRIGITSSLPIAAVSSGNVITLKNLSDIKHVGVGQSVGLTISNINSTASAPLTVEGYDRTTGAIALTPPASGDAVTGSISDSTNVDFTKGVNQSVYSDQEIDYVLTEYKPYRIRFRYFIPQVHDGSLADRNYDVNVKLIDAGNYANLRYTQLYDINYDFSDEAKGDFNTYFDNSIRSGGGTIGAGGPGQGTSNYVTVRTNKKIDIKYSPLGKTRSSSELSTLSLNTTANSPVINIDNTSNIEIGNYVYDDTNKAGTVVIPEGTRIIDLNPNSVIILSNNATATTSGTSLKFVDHRGFVKRIVANNGSTTNDITIHSNYDRTDIRKGMLIIGDNLSENNTKINDVTTGTSQDIKISPTRGSISTNQVFYIYQSDGLINDGLTSFCQPTIDTTQNVCVSVTRDHNPGESELFVNSVDGITTGDSVLGFYFEHQVTDGILVHTTVVDSVDPSTNSFTIKKKLNDGTLEGTSVQKLIASGNNFTISGINYLVTDDKSRCCPQKETSPPFQATEEGMQTTSEFKILELSEGNIKFDALTATINETTPYTFDASGSQTEPTNSNMFTASGTKYATLLGEGTNERVQIKTPSGTFKILAKSA